MYNHLRKERIATRSSSVNHQVSLNYRRFFVNIGASCALKRKWKDARPNFTSESSTKEIPTFRNCQRVNISSTHVNIYIRQRQRSENCWTSRIHWPGSDRCRWTCRRSFRTFLPPLCHRPTASDRGSIPKCSRQVSRLVSRANSAPFRSPAWRFRASLAECSSLADTGSFRAISVHSSRPPTFAPPRCSPSHWPEPVSPERKSSVFIVRTFQNRAEFALHCYFSIKSSLMSVREC